MRFAFALTAFSVLAFSLAPAAQAQTWTPRMDRYGGGAAYAPPQPYAPPAGYAPNGYAPTPSQPTTPQPTSAAAIGLRTLSWPGKALAQPAPTLAPVNYSPPPRYSPPPAYPVQAQPTYAPQAQYAPQAPAAYAPQPAQAYYAPAAQRPAAPSYGVPPPPPPPTAQTTVRPVPTSIYSDAAAAPAQPPYGYAQAAYAPAAPSAAATPAQTVGDSAPSSRRYSVHRDYGMAPDPAPIPPQFFAVTADLSAPETPEVEPRPMVANPTAARATQNAARLAASAVQ
jgi:hypothetical protein